MLRDPRPTELDRQINRAGHRSRISHPFARNIKCSPVIRRGPDNALEPQCHIDRKVSRISTSVLHHPNVVVHHGDSSVELAKAPDRLFDSIYVDGDHSPAGVQRDTDVVKRKLRPGGIVAFNDYTLWSVIEQAPYGICHAVASLLDEGFKLIAYAFQFQGYPDVALVAP